MDSWFTQQPLVKALTRQGLNVIGMVKATNQRYQVGGQLVGLKSLFQLALPVTGQKGVLRSLRTTLAKGLPVKVVFVQNRHRQDRWLALLSTDCTLTEREIIRIYGMR